MESQLEEFARIYRSMETYDGAKELARKLFSDRNNDPDEIQKKFRKLYPLQKNQFAVQALGTAYNIAVVHSLFLKNDILNAENILKGISERDVPILVLASALKMEFGQNYVDLCKEQQKLIVPKDLDLLLLLRYTRGTMPSIDELYESQALFVITNPMDSIYEAKGVTTEITQAAFRLENILGVISMLNKYMITINESGTRDDIEERIKGYLSERNIHEQRIVYAEHEGMKRYLLIRYLIKTAGKMMKDKLLDFNLEHKIVARR